MIYQQRDFYNSFLYFPANKVAGSPVQIGLCPRRFSGSSPVKHGSDDDFHFFPAGTQNNPLFSAQAMAAIPKESTVKF
jgi:hypothetical protein